MDIKKIDFTFFENALLSLKEGLLNEPKNDLERDGVIQRFEYTFEQCWKMIRRVLISLGKVDVSASPKPLFRDALQEGFLDDLDTWFRYLDARNSTTHLYSKKDSDFVFSIIKDFPEYAEKLLSKLKEKGQL
ncbi:MAG: HI0074 family nucleotidyltransferase substrate-binding subunit [Pseudomonadota bacterium]